LDSHESYAASKPRAGLSDVVLETLVLSGAISSCVVGPLQSAALARPKLTHDMNP